MSTRSRLLAGSHSRCLGSGASRASLSLPGIKPKQVWGSASLVTFALDAGVFGQLVEPGVSFIKMH